MKIFRSPTFCVEWLTGLLIALEFSAQIVPLEFWWCKTDYCIWFCFLWWCYCLHVDFTDMGGSKVCIQLPDALFYRVNRTTLQISAGRGALLLSLQEWSIKRCYREQCSTEQCLRNEKHMFIDWESRSQGHTRESILIKDCELNNIMLALLSPIHAVCIQASNFDPSKTRCCHDFVHMCVKSAFLEKSKFDISGWKWSFHDWQRS